MPSRPSSREGYGGSGSAVEWRGKVLGRLHPGAEAQGWPRRSWMCWRASGPLPWSRRPCILPRPAAVHKREGGGMRRRLATLFADIAGSTRLVVQHEPETVLGVFQCFAELVSDIALAHRGHVKDFEGDGVLLYFDSAVDAAEAALAIRAALDREQCDTGCGGRPGAPARLAPTGGEGALGVG